MSKINFDNKDLVFINEVGNVKQTMAFNTFEDYLQYSAMQSEAVDQFTDEQLFNTRPKKEDLN